MANSHSSTLQYKIITDNLIYFVNKVKIIRGE